MIEETKDTSSTSVCQMESESPAAAAIEIETTLASADTSLALQVEPSVTQTEVIPEPEAIPIPASVFSLNKDILRCQVIDHDMARVKFLCIDQNCKCASKLACAECILNDHKDHKYFVLEKFIEQISAKFTRVSASHSNLEDESRMEEFQAKVSAEVRAEFSELKQLVLRSFDEFESEYLQQVTKYFENSKPRMEEHREKFTSIAKIANEKFETLDTDAIQAVVSFHIDEKLESSMVDIEKHITRTKTAISKKKAKYFEKFRAIVGDILTNCKTVPMKEQAITMAIAASPSKSAMAHQTQNSQASSQSSSNLLNSDEKKKRKITFNDEQNIVVYDAQSNTSNNNATASLNAVANVIQQVTKQSNISELQSFSARSFAGETRRFTNAGMHKKLKTEVQQQHVISQTS